MEPLNPKFLRGLLFIATGSFLLLRLAADQTNPFFAGAAWFAAAVAFVALLLLLWHIVYEYR